jgi:hypothetical protein
MVLQSQRGIDTRALSRMSFSVGTAFIAAAEAEDRPAPIPQIRSVSIIRASSQALCTSILRGFACSRFGNSTSSTPLRMRALIRESSMCSLSANCR